MGELGKAELAAATLRKSDPPSNTLFGARISFTQSGGPSCPVSQLQSKGVTSFLLLS
jgi:hypothetical protein